VTLSVVSLWALKKFVMDIFLYSLIVYSGVSLFSGDVIFFLFCGWIGQLNFSAQAAEFGGSVDSELIGFVIPIYHMEHINNMYFM
jgi:hypothetical protein